MKLFSEKIWKIVGSDKGCGRNYVVGRSSKLCRNWCQDVSKVCTMSKVLIVVKLKLVVVPKKKGVSKLKCNHWKKSDLAAPVR